MDAAARTSIPLDLRKTETDAYRAPSSVQASPGAGLDLRLVTSRAAFDALEAPWNDLFARAGAPTHIFQQFNFCWHWANHYLASSPGGTPGVKLSVLTGWRSGALVMVWPLVSQRVRGITQTFWMGEPVGQYGDVLVDKVADADQLVAAGLAYLRTRSPSDILRLRRVRADANVSRPLATAGATVAERQIAPHMDLTSAESFASFEQRYSGSARRNRKRLARRLQDKGPTAFLRFRGGSEARALAIKAIELKSHWLRNCGLVSSAIGDERMARLFGDLAERSTRPVDCIVAALTSNGEPVALEVSFECKKHLAMHLIVFDLAYEKSGAGVLLLEQSLKDGYAEGLETYDMLAPGDSYKLDWCDRSAEVIDWVMPLSVKGTLYARLYLGFIRKRLKAGLKSLPQPLRRLMSAGLAPRAAKPADTPDAE